MNNARERGRNDRRDNKKIDDCPYEDTSDRDSWKDGWAGLCRTLNSPNQQNTKRKG